MKETENKSQKGATRQTKVKESFVGTDHGTSLRSRMASWFECKVRYRKTQSDGSEKMVNELYVVDALSFTEAEASIIDNTTPYISDEFKVANINPASYSEIFFSDINDDDLWFKARLAFVSIDEKTNKEKRSYSNYLIQAKSIERAKRYVDTVMSSGMVDYELKSISETKILDVFEYCSSSTRASEKK